MKKNQNSYLQNLNQYLKHRYWNKVHKYRHRACFEAAPVGSAAPYHSNLFAAAALFRRCFFLSTDTDVGGSKQKHVLLSKTCYQTCTSLYRFDNRSQKPHDFTIVHGWTWFHTVTSLTFRQTRVQALYMDVQRLIEDFCFNRCPKGTSYNSFFIDFSHLLTI